jgi:hypothetical protein
MHEHDSWGSDFRLPPTSVPTLFATFKRLFGENVMAQNFLCIEQELILKIQIYNHYILTEHDFS